MGGDGGPTGNSEKGRLIAVEVDGQTVYRTVKSAKKAAQTNSRMEEVFALIREAGKKGIITTELRSRASGGHSGLTKHLEDLVKLGRIYCVPEGSNTKRYFVTESSLVVV
jgi:hypothetical protein